MLKFKRIMLKTKTVVTVVFLILCSVTFLFYLKVISLETEAGRTKILENVSSLPKGIRSIAEEFSKRADTVKNICRHYHLGKYSYSNRTNDLHIKDSPTPQYSYFYINKIKSLAWCPVYKAGSTSWLHNMMILAGFPEETISNPPKQLSIWARDVYGEGEPGPVFDDAVKLVIVRHPFTRLVSAFRDKLSNSSQGSEHGTAHFYNKYGRTIVETFRSKNSALTQIEPTFEEFVNYLLKTDFVYYDDHWLPVYYACTPCRVDYNFIAKVETLQRDQNFIIEGTKLSGLLKPKWKHQTSTKGGGSTDADDRHYFSMLTKSQIHDLFNKYRMDFELFNYSPEKHLTYALDKW